MKYIHYIKLFLFYSLGSMIVVSSFAIAESKTAASFDWIEDTSGNYLCQGYYSPPFIEGAKDDDLSAEAESTDYDGQDRIILSGNAFLSRNDFQLEADRVSFLNSTGDGDAEGDVKIRRPNTLLIGDEASVNVRTSAFDLKNSSFVTHKNRLRGDSAFAIGAPNGDIRIVDGVITFCAPDINSWDLKADRIFLNQSSGRGWANNVIVRVKEIPVFYSPALGFPLDDSRLTGFLFPRYKTGSSSGTEIFTPFYWNLAPNYDVLIQPRFLTARGPAVGIHARYLFDDLSLFELMTEQLPGDKKTQTDRHISKATIKSDPSQSIIWDIIYEDASDEDYQTDLANFADLSDTAQLTSSVSSKIRGENWTTGWLAESVNVIDASVSAASTKFAKQPQLTAEWGNYSDNLGFTSSSDFTKFTRDIISNSEVTEGLRFSSDLRAESPMSASYGTLTPAALGFIRWSEATIDNINQDNGYFVYGASLDGDLTFEKHGENGALYSIVPRAKILLREPNEDPTIVKFDTANTANSTETVSQLFLDNPISGGDFVGDTRELTMSILSTGIDSSGSESFRITAGRTFYLQNRGITLTGSDETSKQSPLVVDSKVYLTPDFLWNTRFTTISDSESMDTATNEFKYKTSKTDYFTQRVVWDREIATRADLYYSNQFHNYWRMLAGLQWDPQTETRVNQVFSLQYESCCWRVAAVHAYESDRRTVTDGGHSIKLQLELKGLGILGRGASSLMDRLLEDYELSEARY